MDEFNYYEYGVELAGVLPFDTVDFMCLTVGQPIAQEGE